MLTTPIPPIEGDWPLNGEWGYDEPKEPFGACDREDVFCEEVKGFIEKLERPNWPKTLLPHPQTERASVIKSVWFYPAATEKKPYLMLIEKKRFR